VNERFDGTGAVRWSPNPQKLKRKTRRKVAGFIAGEKNPPRSIVANQPFGAKSANASPN
jgi:hypothetical protein